MVRDEKADFLRPDVSVTGLCRCGGSECDGFMWVWGLRGGLCLSEPEQPTSVSVTGLCGCGAQSVTGLCGCGGSQFDGLCGCGGSECDRFMWVWGLRV